VDKIPNWQIVSREIFRVGHLIIITSTTLSLPQLATELSVQYQTRAKVQMVAQCWEQCSFQCFEFVTDDDDCSIRLIRIICLFVGQERAS